MKRWFTILFGILFLCACLTSFAAVTKARDVSELPATYSLSDSQTRRAEAIPTYRTRMPTRTPLPTETPSPEEATTAADDAPASETPQP